MSESTLETLRENISKTGYYPAIIVRPMGRMFQIVDGFHRYIIVKGLGHKKVKSEVVQMGDKEAKLLLATLNRLRGTDDVRKRAKLIGQLAGEFEDKTLLVKLIPETKRAMDALIKAMEKDFLGFDADQCFLEAQMISGGIEPELAGMLAKNYKPPTGRRILTFVFKDDYNYNKALKFFGFHPKSSDLINLIENEKIQLAEA